MFLHARKPILDHGRFIMFEYDFSYNNILSSRIVKKEGILFDERFSFESYWENGFDHYERLFYTNENGEV